LLMFWLLNWGRRCMAWVAMALSTSLQQQEGYICA